MRKPLQKLIVKSWEDCIRRDYTEQRINSERSLQASFWSCLNENIQTKTNRQLFIEMPITIKLRGYTKKVIPDIIICSPQKVIAVIELKYLPRGQPKHEKDIDTLSIISKHKDKIIVTNNRFRGNNKKSTKFSLSDNMLFVWASIHAKEKNNISSSYSLGNKIKGCYLELHAETVENGEPDVYTR